LLLVLNGTGTEVENEVANEFVGIVGGAGDEEAAALGRRRGEFGGSVAVAVAESGKGVVVVDGG